MTDPAFGLKHYFVTKKKVMIALLRFIFIFVIIYYLVRLVVRMFVPYLLKKGMSKMTEKYTKQQNFSGQKQREEGSVTIQKNQETEKKVSSDLGEYVDYEEVKD